jgi:hypothetical protein
MITELLALATRSITPKQVQPGMILTAARAIYTTIYGRDGVQHNIPFANEGDEVRVEAADPFREGDLFTCTNISNADEVGSIPVDALEDVFQEYK